MGGAVPFLLGATSPRPSATTAGGNVDTVARHCANHSADSADLVVVVAAVVAAVVAVVGAAVVVRARRRRFNSWPRRRRRTCAPFPHWSASRIRFRSTGPCLPSLCVCVCLCVYVCVWHWPDEFVV